MSFYPQSILDEIRARICISSLIGEYISLKKAGRNFKGCCPFHAEKKPSFMVSDEKEIFHCFGCGEGGNVFTFIMKYEGLSFPETVEKLAERTNVELPKSIYKELSERDRQAIKKKKLLLRVNKIAAHFFHENLKKSHPNSPIRKYLKSRDISGNIFTQHFLGYADDSWDALYCYLTKKNVPSSLVEELGLIRKRSTGSGYYDFFRKRLIFPIFTPHGDIIGFGGRIISENDAGDVAKYLNSPDSIIYKKSQSAYALNVAQRDIRAKDELILVEGYMDVLALNGVGIMNVVAPLGTSLGSDNVRLLARYSKNMTLVFDGDEAGKKAAARSLMTFLEMGITPRVVILPKDEDPDDFVRQRGREDFDELLKSADSLLSWFIKKKAKDSGEDITKKLQVVSEAKEYLKYINDPVELAYYRGQLADLLGLDESDLLRELKFKGNKREVIKRTFEENDGRAKSERLLLSLIISDRELLHEVEKRLKPSFFINDLNRSLYELLIKEGNESSLGALIDRIENKEIVELLHTLSMNEELDEINKDDIFRDCISYILKCRLSDRLRVISKNIKEAESKKDEAKIIELLAEKKELLSESIN